jgi:hypothetical protein
MDGGLRRQLPGGRLTAARAATLLAIGLLIVELAGCGDSHTASSITPPLIPTATARTANCLLWNALGRSDRNRLILGLREFFTQRLDTGAREQVPPDGRAYTIITRYCRLPFARAFLIYRLYGNAAAFGSQR